MQSNQRVNSLLSQCRLCRDIGHHEIDIWRGNSGADREIDLSEKIFRCVGVSVSMM